MSKSSVLSGRFYALPPSNLTSVDDNNSRRTFHLNLRYSFNAVRSKYQGKGTGGVRKGRM